MFNAGRGRIYASAQGEEDILNLAGQDMRVSGNIKAGNFKEGLSSTQGAQVSDIKNDKIANIRQQPAYSIFTEDDGAYVSNLVSITVDS